MGLGTFVMASEPNATGDFYEKEKIKAFFSFKGDMRVFHENLIADLNGLLFEVPWGNQTDTGYVSDPYLSNYKPFKDKAIGLNAEVGAQYKQFLTWMDIHFMPTQVSEVPSSIPAAIRPYYNDVKWYRYGFDWMFGYMLLPEKSIVNLIPSVGGGFSLLNVRFARKFDLPDVDTIGIYNKYYSSFGRAMNAQLELRFNLVGGVSIGAYAGIRVVRYDALTIEEEIKDDEEIRYFVNTSYTEYEYTGDELFGGVKLTYTLPSRWETRLRDKL